MQLRYSDGTSCWPGLKHFDQRFFCFCCHFLNFVIAFLQLEGVTVVATAASVSPHAWLSHVSVGDVIGEAVTNSKGEFTLGPLHDGIELSFQATKAGYHFKRSMNTDVLTFQHERLGGMTVQVTDSDGHAVAGAVIALSGDDAFRQHGLTSADGVFTSVPLFSGTYFVRPMLKEYVFVPSAHEVNVLEGANVSVKVVATRTAYSAFGSVVALNGLPLSNVAVTATGQLVSEEKTVTDASVCVVVYA